MSYIATIQRVADGVQVDCPMEELDWHDSSEFWWSEGNFACDCNRADCFHRALSGEEVDEECGHERYRVRITLPDGSVPYDELAGDDAR